MIIVQFSGLPHGKREPYNGFEATRGPSAVMTTDANAKNQESENKMYISRDDVQRVTRVIPYSHTEERSQTAQIQLINHFRRQPRAGRLPPQPLLHTLLE